MNYQNYGWMGGFSLVALAVSASLYAAEITATPAGPEGTTDTLQEVVVTAERRAEDVEKVAVSDAVVSGEDLVKENAYKLDDVVQAIPGVKIIGGPAGMLVRIRGEGINIPPNTGDPSVPVMLDGQYTSQVVTTLFGMFDISRVEVLRGPQGTLFGKNSTGGLVNIISNQPVDKEEGMVSLGVGNYNLVQTEAMYNTQVNNQLDMRIATQTTYHAGYLTNGDSGEDAKSVRLSFLYKFNDDWRALLGSEYSTDGGTPPGSVVAYSGDSPASTPAHGSTNPWFDPAPPGSWWDNRAWRTWADVEGDLGWAKLELLPSYQYYTANWHNQFAEGQDVASYQDSLGTYLETSIGQAAVEVHLSSPDSQKIKWLVGLYYYDAPNWKGANENLGTIASPVNGGQNFIDPTAPTYTNTILSNRDYAVFAQTTIPLGDSTRATLGARETEDKKGIVYVNNSANPGLTNWNTTYSTNKLTFTAGVEQDLGTNSLLYAQAASGFIGAAFNTTSFEISPPETMIAYEFGSKNRLLNDTLIVNAEVFDNEVKNSQTFYSVPNPYLGKVIDGVTITSPPSVSGVIPAFAREYGGELETNWLFTASDRLDASLAYLNAHYVRFSDNCVGTGLGCAPGAGSPGYNGSVLPQAPKLTANFGYSHSFRLANNSTFTAHADAYWHDSYYLIFNYKDAFPPFFPPNSAYQGPGTTANAALNWTAPSGKWNLTGNVRNLSNNATKTGWFGPNLQLADPRTYSLNVQVHF